MCSMHIGHGRIRSMNVSRKSEWSLYVEIGTMVITKRGENSEKISEDNRVQ